MILTGLVAIAFGIVIFAKPGAGALAVLALIAAFALVTGVTEPVVGIGGGKASILLALAWAGAWSRETGARLALVAALVQVVAWGFAAGRRAGGSRLTATVRAAGEGMLAVLLLGAERLVQ